MALTCGRPHKSLVHPLDEMVKYVSEPWSTSCSNQLYTLEGLESRVITDTFQLLIVMLRLLGLWLKMGFSYGYLNGYV